MRDERFRTHKDRGEDEVAPCPDASTGGRRGDRKQQRRGGGLTLHVVHLLHTLVYVVQWAELGPQQYEWRRTGGPLAPGGGLGRGAAVIRRVRRRVCDAGLPPSLA